ncbi:hypothetical protein Cs7R123_35470 [Catellatospora sp. TT07R-123]|uniref:hypothetical protein n=1 Tax=Catellatospora sp. TT07R-123 TaxID=2733863 RepID=UPI001B2E6E3C|nr:hypothetical protein [Catellatospora sp. TT07R-123]GHJ46205.1 hypothetical protein Cs7R123_35470 [Catellatospora sp. TT07R-123]
MFSQQVQQFHQLVLGRDPMAALTAVAPLVRAAQQVPPAELTPAVAYLAPAIAAAPLPFVAANAATAAGAMVELGADPGPLTRIVLERLNGALTGTHAFLDAWLSRFPGRPLPERDQAGMTVATGMLGAAIGPAPAMPLLAAWRDGPHWALAAVACLHHETARTQLGDRAAWMAQVDPLHSTAPAFMRLILALRILDEHVLVVHRPSRHGAMVWLGGIADNFQLQVLLADALVGAGLVEGRRPEQRWVNVMRFGPDGTELEHVDDYFHMSDATGAVLRNETGPADISAISGTRILMLDTPRYSRHWRPGRRFPITAQARVDRILTQQEVDAWLGYVAPAQ